MIKRPNSDGRGVGTGYQGGAGGGTQRAIVDRVVAGTNGIGGSEIGALPIGVGTRSAPTGSGLVRNPAGECQFDGSNLTDRAGTAWRRRLAVTRPLGEQ